jgi:spore coat polysaccharide biosynthesis protein SpsF (cytidylyltransferase family)
MGSTRLPGKVLLDIGGRPLLVYLVERIARCRTLDGIVVATTTEPRDDVIVKECRDRGFRCFRGSETDVLGRYRDAAAEADAGIIVRVTADNPFTDPGSIDCVVNQIVECGADYAIEVDLPAGTTGEALTVQALEFIDDTAHTPRWREHVTLYAKEKPDVLKCNFLQPRPGLARPDLSFTVDRDDEYQYVQELARAFRGPHFSLKTFRPPDLVG